MPPVVAVVVKMTSQDDILVAEVMTSRLNVDDNLLQVIAVLDPKVLGLLVELANEIKTQVTTTCPKTAETNESNGDSRILAVIVIVIQIDIRNGEAQIKDDAVTMRAMQMMLDTSVETVLKLK